MGPDPFGKKDKMRLNLEAENAVDCLFEAASDNLRSAVIDHSRTLQHEMMERFSWGDVYEIEASLSLFFEPLFEGYAFK